LKFIVVVAAVFLLTAGACYCADGPLVGRHDVFDLVDRDSERAFEGVATNLVADPYDPGYFAWGLQYHARGCLIMYNLTGERKWLDWALSIADHFIDYSDVNGDGVPAWGNYNETWGNSRYDFREYTVWDGVIGLPIIEAAKAIRSSEALSADPDLLEKSNRYVDLITRVIKRHHGLWTQVSEDQGYYWDDPVEDIGPIVNRFTALGRVELVLGDVTGNGTYYEKPRQMARYLVNNMEYDEIEDLYTWSYWIGKDGSEDISHGAIDLEFLIMANQRGLLEDVHMHRLCNTYLRRIWQLPDILDGKNILAMHVDGSDNLDYTRISRGWILLSAYNYTIFDHQRSAFSLLKQRSGLFPSGVYLLGLAQIPMMEEVLRVEGIDPYDPPAVTEELLLAFLNRTEERMAEAMSLGSECGGPKSMIAEARVVGTEPSGLNNSIALGLIWDSWDLLGRIIEIGEDLSTLEGDITEARGLGVEIGEIEANLTALREIFVEGASESAMNRLEADLSLVSAGIARLVARDLIQIAEELIAEAKEAGIDTQRHETLLQRAREEYDKGNYVPARLFTNYPLTLREDLGEFGSPVLVLAMTAVILVFGNGIFIRSTKFR